MIKALMYCQVLLLTTAPMVDNLAEKVNECPLAGCPLFRGCLILQ